MGGILGRRAWERMSGGMWLPAVHWSPNRMGFCCCDAQKPPIEFCCNSGELASLVPSLTVDFSSAGIVDGTCSNCNEAFSAPFSLPYNPALSGSSNDGTYTYNYIGYGTDPGVACVNLGPNAVSCQIGCQTGMTQKRAYIAASLRLCQSGCGYVLDVNWRSYTDWVNLATDIDCVTAIFGDDWDQLATIGLLYAANYGVTFCGVSGSGDIEAWI